MVASSTTKAGRVADDDEDRVADAVRHVNELSVAYHSWDEQLGESFDEWVRLSLRPWSPS